MNLQWEVEGHLSRETTGLTPTTSPSRYFPQIPARTAYAPPYAEAVADLRGQPGARDRGGEGLPSWARRAAQATVQSVTMSERHPRDSAILEFVDGEMV